MVPAFNVINVASIFKTCLWEISKFVGENKKVHSIEIEIGVNTDSDIKRQAEKVGRIRIITQNMRQVVV